MNLRTNVSVHLPGVVVNILLEGLRLVECTVVMSLSVNEKERPEQFLFGKWNKWVLISSFHDQNRIWSWLTIS